MNIIQSRLTSGDSGAGDYTGLKADGSRFNIDVNGDLILDSGGHTVNMIFVTRDSSERKADGGKTTEAFPCCRTKSCKHSHYRYGWYILSMLIQRPAKQQVIPRMN